MEKNSILLAKNKFTQIATYATYTELTVQSEDRKKEAHCSESISIWKAMNWQECLDLKSTTVIRVWKLEHGNDSTHNMISTHSLGWALPYANCTVAIIKYGITTSKNEKHCD